MRSSGVPVLDIAVNGREQVLEGLLANLPKALLVFTDGDELTKGEGGIFGYDAAFSFNYKLGYSIGLSESIIRCSGVY